MIASAVYQFYRAPPESFVFPIIYVSIAAVVATGIAILYIVKFRRRERIVEAALTARDAARARLLAAGKELNEILAIDYRHCLYLRRQGSDADREKLQHEFNSYLTEVLSHTVALFNVYTCAGDGQTCAACIKVLTLSDQKRSPNYEAGEDTVPSNVYTYTRDPVSRLRRSQVDAKPGLDTYAWAKNAAFAYVMHSQDQHGFFVENDLQHPAKPYWNENERWQEFYSATAVAALKDPQNDNVVEALGFICVDNLHGGFDDAAGREILECIASIVYYTLRITTATMATLEMSDEKS